MAKATCSIDGCEKAARTRGWCPMHYERWRDHGDPIAPHVQTRVSTNGASCSVEGCPSLARSRGLCNQHYQRWWKRGTPAPPPERRRGEDSVQWKGDSAGYTAIHERVAAMFGRASEHQCQHCAKRAREWAYDHTDPDERISNAPGQRSDGLPYSLNPNHYFPLCRGCHVRFDRQHTKTLVV